MAEYWFEVSVDVPLDFGEAVANFLVEQGAPGIQTEDAGAKTTITAHFSSAPPVRSLRNFCRALIGEFAWTHSIRVRQIEAEDWAHNWKLHFRQELVGEQLCICPSWDATPAAGRIAVVIDPGMAFGTGQHTTTRSCLQLLERATQAGPIRRALDVGTGSGILAIALAKLGVPDVWAIDDDPTACAVAQANAVRNVVSNRVRIASSLTGAPGTFPLIAANLFANLLVELAPRLTSALDPGGMLICSGLLTDDEARVRAAFHGLGCDARQRCQEGAWVTLALRRGAEL